MAAHTERMADGAPVRTPRWSTKQTLSLASELSSDTSARRIISSFRRITPAVVIMLGVVNSPPAPLVYPMGAIVVSAAVVVVVVVVVVGGVVVVGDPVVVVASVVVVSPAPVVVVSPAPVVVATVASVVVVSVSTPRQVATFSTCSIVVKDSQLFTDKALAHLAKQSEVPRALIRTSEVGLPAGPVSASPSS